jgi:hypothetical protein
MKLLSKKLRELENNIVENAEDETKEDEFLKEKYPSFMEKCKCFF